MMMRKLLLCAVLLAAACAESPGAQPAASPLASTVQPFAQFLAATSNAAYADYAGRPGVQVKDATAFAEMRAYLLDRYAHTQVPLSYADEDATVDCVASDQAAGTPGRCPSGSVPVRRVTLGDLTCFATLADFLAKAPGGGQLPPVPSR
jgi:hypothetical protein